MKKIVSVLLIMVMCLCLCSCGDKGETTQNQNMQTNGEQKQDAQISEEDDNIIVNITKASILSKVTKNHIKIISITKVEILAIKKSIASLNIFLFWTFWDISDVNSFF